MLKKKIIKATLSLLFVGLITKILSTIGRVVTARTIGQESMGIFMMVMPAAIFFINIIQLSLPTCINKLIAEKPEKAKNIIITSSIIALIVNSLFMITIIAFAPFIANNILKNEKTLLAIDALALLIPLISLGGLIKGYYTGIGKIEITAYSQISEEIARIAFIVLFGGYFVKGGEMYGAYGAILSLCMGEVFSLTHMIVSLKNLKSKTKQLFKGIINEENLDTKNILSMSLPLTGGRLIGSIAYMLEPIIITNVLLKTGMTNDAITLEYGILSGYAMPLLLMPGFFANAYGRVLLQPMTSAIAKNNKKEARKLFLSISLVSLITGAFFSLILFIFPSQLMTILYKSSDGYKYVRFFAIPFILYYLESPFVSALTALNKTKQILFYDVLTSAIRIGLLFILLPKMKMMGVAISTAISFIILVIIFAIIIFKNLKLNKETQ